MSEAARKETNVTSERIQKGRANASCCFHTEKSARNATGNVFFAAINTTAMLSVIPARYPKMKNSRGKWKVHVRRAKTPMPNLLNTSPIAIAEVRMRYCKSAASTETKD